MIDGVNCPRDGRLRSERSPGQRINGPDHSGRWRFEFQSILVISVEATRPSVSGNGNIMVSIKTLLG